jgi:voltage-gated potassium channel
MAETRVESADELTDVKGHILICGWSHIVPSVIDGLTNVEGIEKRPIVLVNQADAEEIGELKARAPQLDLRHIHGPFQLEATLRRAACPLATSAIIVADAAVGLEADNQTIICALAIESMSPEIHTCAELNDRDNESNLKRAGVNDIVITGENTGFFLAAGALEPGIPKAARKLVTFRSGSDVRRTPVPQEFVDRTVGELQEHVRLSGAMLIGVIREAQNVTVADLLGGGTDWIDAFITDSFKAAGEDVLDQDKDPIEVYLNPPDDFVLGFKDSAVLIGGTGENG